MKKDVGEKRDEALSFLVDQEVGVLATVSRAGEAHARLVYYTCDDSFNVYFMTLKNTRKVSDMASNPHAAFVISETERPRTLQMEGMITDLTDTATIDPTLSDFIQRLMDHTKYGIPITRLDESEIKFYRLAPEWVRWGDFTFGQGTDAVLTEVDPKDLVA
jgi:general stress protein 26